MLDCASHTYLAKLTQSIILLIIQKLSGIAINQEISRVAQRQVLARMVGHSMTGFLVPVSK